MNFATLAVLGIAFAYGVLKKGGVEQDDWNIVLLLVGVAGCVHFLLRLRDRPPRLDRIAALSAAAVLFFVALQLLPLPVTFVRLLSPKRAELAAAAVPLTGLTPKFITLSAVPQATLAWLLTLAAYLLVFLLVRDLTLRFGESPWRAAWPILLVGAFEGVLGLYQVNGGNAPVANGTYVNRDHYAGLLEMILPFAAMYALTVFQRDRNRLESPAAPALKASLLLAVTAIVLVGIVFSLSRMAYLSALAALLVAGFLASPLGGWHLSRPRAAPLWRRWALTAILIVIIVLGFILLPSAALTARFAALANTDDISADTRAQLWRDTIGLIKDYPAFGCGMGAYESCFLRYKTVAPMFLAERAHNDYLQVLAELGVFGFAAGLLFVFRVLQRSVLGALYARSGDERYLAIACVAAMTAMLFHSLVDFNMYIPANAMLFAWVAGIAGVHLGRRRFNEEEIPHVAEKPAGRRLCPEPQTWNQ